MHGLDAVPQGCSSSMPAASIQRQLLFGRRTHGCTGVGWRRSWTNVRFRRCRQPGRSFCVTLSSPRVAGVSIARLLLVSLFGRVHLDRLYIRCCSRRLRAVYQQAICCTGVPFQGVRRCGDCLLLRSVRPLPSSSMQLPAGSCLVGRRQTLAHLPIRRLHGHVDCGACIGCAAWLPCCDDPDLRGCCSTTNSWRSCAAALVSCQNLRLWRCCGLPCRHWRGVSEPRQAVLAELVQVQARVQVQPLDDEGLAVPHALRCRSTR